MELPDYHPFVSADAKAEYLKMYDEKAKRWPVPSETRTVETSWGKTFVRISGPADAPPLVLLSGLGGNALFWMAQIKPWSERYRVYAVDDIYGYGRSVYTRMVDSIDDFVSWFDELLAKLQLGKVSLVGKSYGGWQIGQYALRHPEKLDKVVLIAPAALLLPVREEVLTRMVTEYSSPRDLLFWINEDFARKDEASRRALEALIDESMVAGRCFNFKPHLAPTIMEDDELRGLKIPVLFLMGENEKIYSTPDAVARLQKVTPHHRVEVISRAGHDLNIVEPETVNRLVLEFLGEP